MGVIFNIQNSQLLTLSLPTEEIFENRAVAIIPVVDFCSQPGEMPLRNFRFFFSYFGLLLPLGKFERHRR